MVTGTPTADSRALNPSEAALAAALAALAAESAIFLRKFMALEAAGARPPHSATAPESSLHCRPPRRPHMTQGRGSAQVRLPFRLLLEGPGRWAWAGKGKWRRRGAGDGGVTTARARAAAKSEADSCEPPRALFLPISRGGRMPGAGRGRAGQNGSL